ncbi:MAG: SNF2-related protein [Bacillota bacterium]
MDILNFLQSIPYRLDTSYINAGFVPLNLGLRQALPRQPQIVPFSLRSHDGRGVKAELHNLHGVFYGPGLKEFFQQFETIQFRVFVDRKHYTVTFIPTEKKVETLSNWPTIAARQGKQPTRKTGELKTGSQKPTKKAGKPGKNTVEAKQKENSPEGPPVRDEDPSQAYIKIINQLQVSAGITFNDTPWFDIERAVKQGKWASSLEEYVHERAVLLSANPGFDTLLSLNMIRNAMPFDYQIRAVKEVLQQMRGRALLCDEVGLGKTIEAALVVSEYLLRGLARKVLILCPSSLVEQWAEEFRSKFNLSFTLFDDLSFQQHPNPWQAFDQVIASLDTVKREPHRSKVLATFFDIVVVDEAHRCRNRSTMNWTFINQLQKKYILLLTATPIQNDLEELFNLITLLRPGQLETATSFARNFITRGDRMKPKDVQRLHFLTREVMIRNKRSSVGISLPRRAAETIQVSLSSPETALYEGVTEFVRRQYGAKGTSGSNQMVLKTLQREVGSSPQAILPTLEKMAASAKDANNQRQLRELLTLGREIRGFSKGEALIRLLRALRERKVIVFTGFRQTQEALAKLCLEAGIPVALFHGQMRRLEKEEAINRFAADIPVLISTESGGEGRNLQFCHTMINFDLPWNPMRIEQRIGRIHRIGQTNKVHIYNLAAAGTIEEKILNLLDTKINLFELVVGELDMILGDLTEGRDFEDLLMEIWAGSTSQNELERQLTDLGEAMARSKENYLQIRQKYEEIFG